MIIHRHQIPRTSEPFTLPIHPDAVIVAAGHKENDPDSSQWHVWEVHDDEMIRPQVLPERRFRIVATGESFTGTHRATFHAGPFVFHLIEDTDE